MRPETVPLRQRVGGLEELLDELTEQVSKRPQEAQEEDVRAKALSETLQRYARKQDQPTPFPWPVEG